MAPYIGTGDAPRFELDKETLISLSVAFSLMPLAQLLARVFLPDKVGLKYRALFIWHAYDSITHFALECSYLYHCFFSYIELPLPTDDYPHPASRGIDHLPLLWNRSDRRYGPFYGTGPMARLWQEYAKADKRWGGADLTVISLEILTCFIMAPLAVFVCYQVRQMATAQDELARNTARARTWFAAIFIATGELYGGFMTFAPEWLSGNTMLSVDDPVFLWLHLTFFNTIWVFVPLWVLYAGYDDVTRAFTATVKGGKKTS